MKRSRLTHPKPQTRLSRRHALGLMVAILLSLVVASRPIICRAALAEDQPQLAHGSTLRDHTRPQEPIEVYVDLRYLQQAIRESDFPSTVRVKLYDLLTPAAKEVLASVKAVGNRKATAEQITAVARIRRDFDETALSLLNAQQVIWLNRRLAVIAMESLILADGTAAIFFREIAPAAGIRLSEKQRQSLQPALERDYESLAKTADERAVDVLLGMREHIRQVLTESQCKAWNTWALTALDPNVRLDQNTTKPAK